MAVPRIVPVVGQQRGRRGLELRAPGGGVHDLVADEDAGMGGHGGADGGEDLDAVGVGPVVSGFLLGTMSVFVRGVCVLLVGVCVEWSGDFFRARGSGKGEGLQDVAEPVDLGTLHGVGVEEIVFHELDSALGESGGCFFGPGALFRSLEYGAAVLDDELQAWVQPTELHVETAETAADVDDGSFAERVPWIVCTH